MPTGPAARVADNVLHPIPPMLGPGPGSLNVLIGGKPSWRGVPAGAAAAIQSAKASSDATIKVAEAATMAASGSLAFPAVKAAEEATKAAAAASMGSMISGVAGGADVHMCGTPLPLPPHGPGVVIDGSPTVLINGLQACRMGDTIVEAVGPPNKIAMGCPTVIIGDGGGGSAAAPAPLALEAPKGAAPPGAAGTAGSAGSPASAAAGQSAAAGPGATTAAGGASRASAGGGGGAVAASQQDLRALAASDGASAEQVAARKKVANDFYDAHGMTRADRAGHLKGIDFTKPVSVETVPAGTTMYQFQGNPPHYGSYFSKDPNVKPGDLGIEPRRLVPASGNTPPRFVTKQSVGVSSLQPHTALRSTAAPIDPKWDVPIADERKFAKGGGEQFYSPSLQRDLNGPRRA